MRQGEPISTRFLLRSRRQRQGGWQVGSACGVKKLPDWICVQEHWQNPDRQLPPLGHTSKQLPHETLWPQLFVPKPHS